MGKKTAEAKGKYFEYNRVYWQQKQAGETAEETETRLAKRREAWKERIPEVKGNQKEYNRVYNFDKMQNETEEDRTNRLQKRKQHQAKLKQLMNEQEYFKYYEHFFMQQVQMKMTKNQMSS
jgi:hypothetical protein